MVTDGIRNIKSMWEKGNVFSAGGSPASTNKVCDGHSYRLMGGGRDPLFLLEPFPVRRHILNFNLKGSFFFRPLQDAAGIKVGVAGRINDWLNKTPETGKMSGGRPTVSL